MLCFLSFELLCILFSLNFLVFKVNEKCALATFNYIYNVYFISSYDIFLWF